MGRKSGRSLNPADQYRKEQHKREIKKNKKDRQKIREIGTALRDTTTETELTEYEELEKAKKLDKEGLKKLEELKEKMTKIVEIKKAHGIKVKPKKVEPEKKPVAVEEPARDPTRSIYYDPILNPYGAPPPGQPYLEYPPLLSETPFGVTPEMTLQEPSLEPGESESGSDESDSDSDSDTGSDSDSSTSGSDSDSEEDEDFMPSLPEGPAPSKEDQIRYIEPAKPKIAIDSRIQQQQRNYGPPMHGTSGQLHPMLQRPPGPPMTNYGPPPPMGHQLPSYGNSYPPGPPPMGYIPPPMQAGPPGFGPPMLGYSGPPGYGPPGGYGGPGGFGPLRPPGPPFHTQQSPHSSRPMRPPSQRPPPPRYVKPPRTSDPQSDPMMEHLPPDEKEVKRAAAEANKKDHSANAPASAMSSMSAPTPTHPLPSKPGATQMPTTRKPTVVAGPASISAEPQLRNLQKELVHLVPSTLMRKRAAQKGKIGKPVNAAPGVDEDDVSSSFASNKGSNVGMQPHSPMSGSDNLAARGSIPTPQDHDSSQEYRETGLGLRLPKIDLAPSVPNILGPRKMIVNSAPDVPVPSAPVVDREAKKKAEYDEFLQSLEGDGLL